MIRLADALVSIAPSLPLIGPRRQERVSTAEAAFCAGAALNDLDRLVRAQPVWAGAWRQRLALTCAAAAVRRLGLKEDEAQLRDAWHLRAAGSDPGPAGRLYGAWRVLAARSPTIDLKTLRMVAVSFGVELTDDFEPIAMRLKTLVRAAPFAAAAVIAETVAARPDAELLAWQLGDCALARQMRWPVVVPLLMGQFYSAPFRAGRGRVKPGEEEFERAICLALVDGAADACRLAADIGRKAEQLQSAAPKLRAKGAGEAISLLLDDDAVSGSLTTPHLSRFASRRLFDRLFALGAVRELTGRSTFRLYGL